MVKEINIRLESNNCGNSCYNCPYKGIKLFDNLDSIVKEFKKLNIVTNIINDCDFAPITDFDFISQDMISKMPQNLDVAEYLNWLKSFNIQNVTITFYGLSDINDKIYSRSGMFDFQLELIDLLLNNNIIPKIRIKIYQNRIADINRLIDIIKSLNLEERCKNLGKEFHFFLSDCKGHGRFYNLSDYYLTRKSLNKLDKYFQSKTCSHYQVNNIKEIFTSSQTKLYYSLFKNTIKINLIKDILNIIIDSSFNVYYADLQPSKFSYLGNLISDGASVIILNYQEGNFLANRILNEVTFLAMLEACGDSYDYNLFLKEDYLLYILNKYLQTYCVFNTFGIFLNN